MARRARVHSRDLQPQIVAPKGIFAAARVQRFDWPMNIPTTVIDELGRKLHVGVTREIPEVTVTLEAFDVSHNIFSYLTGYTPGTFPLSGAQVADFKNVDVVGQIRNANTLNIVNALYVKRGIVTGMDATFGVRDNSSVSYTVSSNSKKEFSQPVRYDGGVVSATSGFTLSLTPTYLTRTSGYIIDAYRVASDGTQNYLDEKTDYVVTGTAVDLTLGANAGNVAVGDSIWFTYCNPTAATFQALDDVAPAAIQGKYVPVEISVNSIPRVQSASVRASFTSESIYEMGGLGKPVGYEIGIPDVTGDISVLKTDNDLLAILEGVANTTVEYDTEYTLDTLPLKITLKDPANPSIARVTYYVPKITITSHGDDDTVNAGMNETFSWQSTTGELYVASGAGPW